MIAIKNPYIIEKAGHLAIMATDNIWIEVLYQSIRKRKFVNKTSYCN